ncbi:MAG: hypothetical protein V4517_05150 [Pseudomonadota bacterium]
MTLIKRIFACLNAGALALVASIAPLAAQGLPVQNGPAFPVALMWIGSLVLGLLLIYGIARNRRRTRPEKQLTEQATRNLYAEEARDEKRGN